ncbi:MULTISPECIES: 8-oxo-dGTP diphosphatase [unclassified Paenibacillus]|uniref:NUDIX hydrolase n=1 Tax=unclassified Paenibacillus TaxID=185978 RepID=UPI001C1229DE|nr:MULTISPECIES: 8-oxo-dGTP diphosphatase [unclassified Paenibacillus]MBU5443223.1 8-oxo-dGTP diphosphatase [Paenibacillus sp. MSJ-34]CAH0121377.1 8-oxo-dGTP diphosphatase [Paenibacillus sp. CECT 9249]
MLKYTICFIKQDDRILLLNRNAPAWMGKWNGVGGKLEPGESPTESVIREVLEETGIRLQRQDVSYKGIVSWTVDGQPSGGMYAYTAELPSTVRVETPLNTEEGILDWKELSWIMHPDNKGIADNVPAFLPVMLQDRHYYDHRCIFDNGMMTGFVSVPMEDESPYAVELKQYT